MYPHPESYLLIQPDLASRPCGPALPDVGALYNGESCLPPTSAYLHQNAYLLDPNERPMAVHTSSSTNPRYTSGKRSCPKESSFSSAKIARTVPRSRHCGSPSPSDSESREDDRYMPYKTTAQGFPVNNKVKKAKYATSIDDRGYLTVYEFQLNDQTIMWDYNTGLVHLTGIWKALGNSKADIVRLVENHPELEGVIKRIRGGFLKIQGTWVPYDLCRRLAIRTCYTIRHALISVFGPEFPDECLRPGIKGYGTLTLDDTSIDKKRKKRKPTNSDAKDENASKVESVPSIREKRPRLAATASGNEYSTQYDERSESYFSDREDEQEPQSQQHVLERSPAPGLPRIVDLPHNGYYPSKIELLDLLRASRSLQKLSAGGHDDWTNEGGYFNIAGGTTTFMWDGSDELEVMEPETYTTMDRMPSWQQEQQQQHRQRHLHASPPQMSRKYSSTTQESSLGDYPITPPQTYSHAEVELKGIADYQMCEPAVSAYHLPRHAQHEQFYYRHSDVPGMRDHAW